MKITRLYVDDQGETHFGEIEVAWKESGPGGKLSERFKATGIIFRQSAASYDYDWHNAPRKQYIVNLDASVEITVSDGEKRVIGPGEVFLVEDTHGKGHISRAVNNQVRHSIFVPVD
jgi:quercetin dioxygenase-like cupin family protein